MQEVAARIFALVAEKGMEHKEFAARIGVSKSTVSNWNTGVVESFKNYLPQIAVVLGTTTDYLLTGNNTETRDPAGREASEVRQEFMELFSRLSPEEQAREIAYLRERVNGSGK